MSRTMRIPGWIARSVTGWFKPLEIGSRLKDEIVALLLFTFAVIVALPLLGLANGTVLAAALEWLRQALGRATLAVPFGLSILAVEVWCSDQIVQRGRRVLGGATSLLAIVGLLSLARPDLPRAETGGYLGNGVTFVLQQGVGEVGAALFLFTLGVIGVLLVTGNDIQTLRWLWSRLRYRPPELAWENGPDTHPAVSGGRTDYHEVTQTDSLTSIAGPAAAEAPQEPAEPERQAPVINIPAPHKPKPDPAASEIQNAVAQVTQSQPELEAEDDTEEWRLPTLDLLSSYESAAPDEADLERKSRLIEETLASFKVEATVREVFPGPAVTLFAVEPGTGVKVSRITGLQNDLALALAAPSIRIEAPVPGMARVGIEIPNRDIATVGLREILESSDAQSSKAKLPLPLGRDVNGRAIIGDLTRMPHMLIAGATGSGKSVCINSIISTFLLTKSPDDLRMIMIDPKMVELVGYKHVPHLQGPLVTEMDKVVSALRMVLKEMERRYQIFADLGVRNLDGYNLRREEDPGLEKLPYLVVIIDELADLMMTTPEEVETLLARLCQMARATGIHLLIATQRPSVDVLTGIIKANVPARIAFAVASLTDSRVILDMPGAERLLGSGDMLYMPPDAAKPHRVQGSFIDDRDLHRVVTFWRNQVPRTGFEMEWDDFPSASDPSEQTEDPLREQAVEIVKQQGTASASMLQRRLRIGYNRAARLIETMEAEGVVGPAEGSRGRTVYLGEPESE